MKTLGLKTFTHLVSNKGSRPGRQITGVMLRVFLLLATSLSVSAATLTWNGGAANGNWSSSANWSGTGTPASGDILIFSGSVRLLNTNNIAGLTLNQIRFAGTSGGFDIRGNAFTLTNNIEATNSAGANTIENNITLANVNQIFDVTVSLTLSGVLSGSAGVIKNGAGTLTLTGADTYTGSTTLNAGGLALVGSGAISGSGIITVIGGTLSANGRSDGTLTLPSGQTLAGSGGVIAGLATVSPGAVVSPGVNSMGTLTFSTNVTLAGTAIMEISKTGGTAQNDLITGVSTLNYGGTLVATNITSDGTPLLVGDSFTLFNAVTPAGNFTSIVGSPGPGLAYSFNPASGILTVIPTGPPAANNVAVVNTVNGSSIGVYFGQVVTTPSATSPTNYTVYSKGPGGLITVTNVIRQTDAQSVELYLSSPVGEFFAVAVSNVVNTVGSNINVTATGYTTGYASTNIGTAADPSPAGDIFSAFTDTFSVTASGSDIGGTNDHCQFVFQRVIGDFDVSMLMTRLDNVNSGTKAGLMAREYLTPGSKSVQTYLTPVIAGTNSFQSSLRSSSNGVTAVFATRIITNGLNWLRLNRTSNTFSVYYGTNGTDWLFTNTTSATLNSNLYIGMTATAHANGQTTTATFTDFGFSGKRPGDGVVPAVSAAIYHATNLVIHWLRTSNDFTVQVTTNLLTCGGSVTNALPWAFVISPIYDTSLTGTNDMMPAVGRYMILPTDLFSNAPIFVRLAQITRVIPDPVVVTPGMVFSPANMSASGSANICGANVDGSTAVAQSGGAGGYIICPPGKGGQKMSYQFTTVHSPSTLRMGIQAKSVNTGIPSCDSSYTDGNTNKSQVTILQTNTSSTAGFTFVAGVVTNATYSAKPTTNCPILVQINIITNAP